MKEERKDNKYIIAIVALLLVCVSVGYAALNANLNVNGTATITENTWKVYFTNYTNQAGVTPTKDVEINLDTAVINYEIALDKPGDYFEFEVDVVNEGSIDAKVGTHTLGGITEAEEKYIRYTVTYADGTPIQPNDELAANGGKKTIKVHVEYRQDIDASDLPMAEEGEEAGTRELSLTYALQYVQK